MAAAQMTTRVATNTLFGLGGILDVASDLGIERQREDFGPDARPLGAAGGAVPGVAAAWAPRRCVTVSRCRWT